jgi:hypothetical protein
MLELYLPNSAIIAAYYLSLLSSRSCFACQIIIVAATASFTSTSTLTTTTITNAIFITLPGIHTKRPQTSLADIDAVSESVRGDVMETTHMASKAGSVAASMQLHGRVQHTALADSHQVRGGFVTVYCRCSGQAAAVFPPSCCFILHYHQAADNPYATNIRYINHFPISEPYHRTLTAHPVSLHRFSYTIDVRGNVVECGSFHEFTPKEALQQSA